MTVVDFSLFLIFLVGGEEVVGGDGRIHFFLFFIIRIYGRRIARRNYIEFIVELLAAAAVRVPMMMPGIAVVVAFRIVPNWLVDC